MAVVTDLHQYMRHQGYRSPAQFTSEIFDLINEMFRLGLVPSLDPNDDTVIGWKGQSVSIGGAGGAPIDSPTFTGIPKAPTAAVDTSTTQLATTAFVLNQAYAKLASPALTGNPTAPTQAVVDSSTRIATTAFVAAQSKLTIVDLSAAKTFALADLDVANRANFAHPAADTTARAWAIPANVTVAFPVGTKIVGFNEQGAGALTISITTDTLMLAGTAATTGARTVATGGIFVLTKTRATTWMIGGPGVT